MVHDLWFSAGVQEREREEPVNTSTHFEDVPACEIATVVKELFVHLMGLRTKYPRERVLIQKIDVKSAFRYISVDPAGVPAFAFIVKGFLAANLRLQCGWRGSPGLFGLFALAIEKRAQAYDNTVGDIHALWD